jgi:hypothetical protein
MLDNLEVSIEYLVENTGFSERDLLTMHEARFMRTLNRTMQKQAAKIEAAKKAAEKPPKPY